MILTRRNLLAAAAASAALPAFAQTEAPVITDMAIGSPDAKVVIDEYLSFTCPHCANFHKAHYAQLKADYIDTGKVRLVYHEVYFDQLGLLGAMMARAGGEMKYFGIVSMLLERQQDWAGAADLDSAVAEMKKIGVASGLTEEAIDAALRDQAMAEALVAHYQSSIEAAFPNNSFEGTPSFLLNGVVTKAIYEGVAYADLKAVIDAELAK